MLAPSKFVNPKNHKQSIPKSDSMGGVTVGFISLLKNYDQKQQ